MARQYQRYQHVLVYVVLLAVPFFFLRTNLKDPSRLTSWDRVILTLSAPAQHAADAVAEVVVDLWTRYIALVRVAEDNERMRFESDRLKEENRQVQLLWEENRRLRNLLGFKESFAGTLVPARVIGRDVSEFYRVLRLRIDAQGADIDKGMPVITFDGLAGQISRVFGQYAEVLLTVDTKSAVDVAVQRNGANGMLRGTGEVDRYSCELEYLLRSDEVMVGDLLFTSGLAGKFPSGILAGRISRIERQTQGLYQKVRVEPAVDFSRLREVFIVTRFKEQESAGVQPGG